jgi:hypothetical protein
MNKKKLTTLSFSVVPIEEIFMKLRVLSNRPRLRAFAQVFAVVSLIALVGSFSAFAQNGSIHFWLGNLVVSRSVYDNNPNNIQVGATLPPNCANTQGGCSPGATNDGSYPFVWNNALADGSFGITSKIFLDQITPAGALVNSLEVTNSSEQGVPPTKDQMVTSFSSKSELALNLSTDHNYLTFMGYIAPIDAIDVSNSNTPGVVDPTNPVGENSYRAVAQVDQHGKFRFTETNAYSGNNGRAAILNNIGGANLIYTAGNAGNGANPQPDGIIIGAGAQIIDPEVKAEVAQSPGTPTPVASFNITELGAPHDKIGKDDNFRGLTIFDNVVYYTKGSGSNGVNTVYFVDTTGQACPSTSATPGIGLPQSSASLPASGLPYDPAVLQTEGLVPNNLCILKGFPSTLNSKLKTKTTAYPFGLWFANATTLYVADEGDGVLADTGKTPAGLQKWVFDSSKQTWEMVYTLQKGLDLGVQYSIPAPYPTGNNSATGLPWAPETDGLRNITGHVNGDGTATIYGITSTVSGNGDQGADPNRLVAITDTLSATTLPDTESFTTLRTAGYGEVLRGVSWAPGTKQLSQ